MGYFSISFRPISWVQYNHIFFDISDTEILTLLKTSANPKSGKKKKKAAEKAVASETAGDVPPTLTPAAAPCATENES